ncbi:hypothetical protein D3C75_1344010 [compost metagenome]
MAFGNQPQRQLVEGFTGQVITAGLGEQCQSLWLLTPFGIGQGNAAQLWSGDQQLIQCLDQPACRQ